MSDIEKYIRTKSDYVVKNFSDSLPSYTPVIDDAIRKAGVFTRYFAHPISKPTNITELSRIDYDKISTNPFFVSVKIRWYIQGIKETQIREVLGLKKEYIGVRDSNKQSVKETLLTMPALGSYISDYLQYWHRE